MAKKAKFRNNLNSRYFDKKYEKNDMPSMTVPNQSMTPRELLIRFASGIPLEAGKVPLYDGENKIPDLDKMDQIELDAYYRELKEQRQQVTERIKSARQKAEEIKMKEVVEQRVKDRRAEIEKEEFENWKKQKAKEVAND